MLPAFIWLLPSVCGNPTTKATKHEGTSITHHEPSAWYKIYYTIYKWLLGVLFCRSTHNIYVIRTIMVFMKAPFIQQALNNLPFYSIIFSPKFYHQTHLQSYLYHHNQFCAGVRFGVLSAVNLVMVLWAVTSCGLMCGCLLFPSFGRNTSHCTWSSPATHTHTHTKLYYHTSFL